MQDTHGHFTHPEVWHGVFREFQRLHEKHPTIDGTAKWAMARDLCWTLALADTSLIKAEMGLK